MNVCVTISILDLAGSSQLAGATDGHSWFLEARSIVDAAEAGTHMIDFHGVQIATVSWLREAVLALVKYGHSIRPDINFVMGNLSPVVREELQVALDASGLVAVILVRSGGAGPSAPLLIGHLDAALRETFQVIEGRGEFDASIVCREISGIAPSAANNRLAALEAKGVLISERRGRSRIYRPILENLHYGN